jgi:molybdopterin molybdotransferase
VTNWQEALKIILSNVAPIASERLPLDGIMGLVAAEDVFSPERLPPFDNSAMDGFAVRHDECEGASADNPVALRILESLPAGKAPSQAITAGYATRIMTGAHLPEGCDAIAPVENTRTRGDSVEILRATNQNSNIRYAGEDIDVGQPIIFEGNRFGAAHIGLLGALGIAEVPAIPPAKVAVITTGSELVDVSEKPGPGKIRDANIHSLCALIRSWGASPVAFPRVGDARQSIEDAISMAAGKCDMLVTTGGVSLGDYDHVKETLDILGAARHFWKIAQKPGGPMGFWTLQGRPFFGIPGNPVSAIVMAELYLKPAIHKMMGHPNFVHRRVIARLDGGYRKSGEDGKRHFLRVIANEGRDGWVARLSGPQGSAQLTTSCAANALAMIPEDRAEIKDGGEVELIFLG